MKKLFTLFVTLCAASVMNVARAQCVITAVPDPTAGYTPTQIINGSFDEEPWMVFTYQGVTYYTCPDNRNFDTTKKDNESGYAQDVVFNGVDGGWNTTDRTIWRGSLFEITNTNSGTHDYIHNSSIPGTDKYVEMNNYHACMLYQDLTTYSHDVIRWTLKHAVTTGGDDYQPIRVEIGAPNRDGNGNIVNASGWATNLNPQIDSSTLAIFRYDGVTDRYGNTSNLGFGSADDLRYLRLHNTAADQRNGWYTAQGIYLIPEGQTVTRFGFISEAVKQNQGNLLDDLTFTTIIGGLTASYGENGSIVVCGFWGEDDASKHLIIDVNSTNYEVDMSAVSGQHFTLSVPESCIGGTVTSVSVYHEDYPGASSTIVVNQPISVTVEDVNAVYDGIHSWGITAVVTEPASGYTLTYGTSYNDCNDAVSPTFMLPGTHYAYYTISAPGYTTVKRKATVFIDKAPFPSDVTITPPVGISGLVYNKTYHTLITAGSATGGYEMVYALGADNVTAPTTGWSTTLPKGRAWGNYYVWYKVIGDDLHNDSEPQCIVVNIAEPEYYTVSSAVEAAGMGSVHLASIIFSEDFDSGVLNLPSGWTNDASHPWIVVEKDGSYCLKSCIEGLHSTTTSLSIPLSLPYGGVISFRAKVSSESCCDRGRFYKGSSQLWDYSGDWQDVNIELSAGTHTYQFVYRKDVSVNRDDDACYIDDIVIREYLPTSTTSVVIADGDDEFLKAVNADESLYHFVNWTDDADNELGTSTTLSFPVTRNITATANFAVNPVLTIQSDGTGNGTIAFGNNVLPAGVLDNGDGTYTVIPGTQITLKATPAEGSFFASWDNASNNSTRSITVNSDITATATFTVYATLQISSNNESLGTVALESNSTSEQQLTIYDGANVTNFFIPTFLGYYDELTKSQHIIPADKLTSIGIGGIISSITYYIQGDYSFTTDDNEVDVYLIEVDYTTLNAYVNKDECTIVYTGQLTAVGKGDYSEIAITFDAPYTYHGGNLLVGIENLLSGGTWWNVYFLGETVIGASSGTNNNTFSQQNFLPKSTFTYTPGLPQENPAGGYYITPGDAMTVTASVNSGYYFVGWEDGGTDLSRDVTVNDDMTITALFGLELDDAVDNTSIMAAQGSAPEIVKLDRPLLRNGDYNTICLPFDLSYTQLHDPTCPLYNCSVSELTDMWVVGNELRLLISSVSEMEAGKPYLVKYNGEASNLTELLFYDVTVTASVGTYTQANGAKMHGILKPTHLVVNDENYLFLMAGNKLAWANVDNAMKSFRAYFVIEEYITPHTSAAPIQRGMPARLVEQRDQTTGIASPALQGRSGEATKILRDGQLIIICGEHMYNAQGHIIQ